MLDSQSFGNEYLLIDKNILPEVFEKVLYAKELLEKKRVKTINDACRQSGISRSVFYKYKDHVYKFNEKSRGKIITIGFVLTDEEGVLSSILKYFAEISANILTINQTIPIKNTANVTISIRTSKISAGLCEIKENLMSLSGVLDLNILASE